MKAWRFHGLDDWRLDEVPLPEPGRGEVLVKVRVVQPSVTDVIASRLGDTPTSARARQLVEERAPISLFGHEYAGDVAAVGPGVTRFKAGDRVASIDPQVPCGTCSFCSSERAHLCRSRVVVGYEIPGCLAEYAAVPEQTIIALPDSLTYHVGAAIQPQDTSLPAVLTAGMSGGETIAVFGQGVIGSGVMQIAKAKGAARAIVTDVRQDALGLAHRLGADEVIDASKTDPVKVILDLTEGRGVDVAFDAAGGDPEYGLAGHETLLQAIESVAVGGAVVQPAIVSGRLDVGLDLLRSKQMHLAFPRSLSLDEMEDLVSLIADGELQLEPTINHVVEGLEKAPESFAITGRKLKHGAINPCQIKVA